MNEWSMFEMIIIKVFSLEHIETKAIEAADRKQKLRKYLLI